MARTRTLRTDNTWPGFVDALATLLLVMIFLLVVFMLAHFFLSQALSGRDEALLRLNDRISELAELLSMERQAAADMRLSVAQLSASLQAANRERDELSLRLRDTLAEAELAGAALAAADREIEVGREAVTARLSEVERLNRDIAALRDVRDDLEDEVAALAFALNRAGIEVDRLNAELSTTEIDAQRREAALQAALAELTSVRDQTQELVATLAGEQERTSLVQRQLEEREIRLAEVNMLYNGAVTDLELVTQELGLLQGNLINTNAQQALTSAELAEAQAELERRLAELSEEQRLSLAAQQEVALLNQQLASLRDQLSGLEALLQESEQRDRDRQVEIQNLGQRLNSALAQQVEELSRYRSDFFGRLRNVLGARSDVTIVGDRFVFQSEVLFEVGAATLAAEGQIQLARLASALMEIATQIPGDINWVLRVDGHTDVRPINTPLFPSNWELSTARAVSVVKFLSSRGVPESRLAATGFGEFQPIDERPIEDAYLKNRRIELKLTER